jgi:hypothetical protein
MSDQTELANGRQKVLFIGGIGRSGSTLIEKMLNELPEMFAIGETVHLWERGVRDNQLCGCSKPFHSCSHWGPVGTKTFGGWNKLPLDEVIDLRWSVDRSRRVPQLFNAHRSKKPTVDQQEYLDYIVPVLVEAGAKANLDSDSRDLVLLDSSKHLSAAALYSLDPRLDVRVLHVVRDPRGVAFSWTKQVERPEADGELMPTYDPKRTAARWVSDNLGFKALAKLGVPTMVVRYEDFMVDPTAQMQAIAEFAGLSTPVDLGFLHGDQASLVAPMHSVAGNPMRFGAAEIRLRLDDAWRTKLDPKSRRTVTAITAPVLGLFGYKR